jgi:hypothetical protein
MGHEYVRIDYIGLSIQNINALLKHMQWFYIHHSLPCVAHETLDPQLLELVNRGMHPSEGTIQLHCVPHHINQTIQNLMTDWYQFAAARMNIEGNHLALNFSKQIDTTQCPIEFWTDHKYFSCSNLPSDCHNIIF